MRHYWAAPISQRVSQSACDRFIAHHEGRWTEVQFLSKRTAWVWWVHESKLLRNTTSRSAFPIDFSPPAITNVYNHWALEGETLLCLAFWSAKLAFPWGTGAGKLSNWTPVLTQYANRKQLASERLSPFHKSVSNITHSVIPKQNVMYACCTLYSMPSMRTVWCGIQCSVLCFACCCATLQHLHTSSSNANANRALVPQYRNVSAGVNLRVVRKHCQTAWTSDYIIYCHDMGLYSHCSTVTLCVLHFAGGFPYTIQSTLRSQHSPRFHLTPKSDHKVNSNKLTGW